MKSILFAAGAAIAAAQDPAQGWLGYATAQCPAGTELTLLSAFWPVGATPRQSNSFYSPWFGQDSSDNLNLLQPVNPWLGNEWQIYNEYFQWQPEYNYNSDQHTVKAGDMLFGSITFTPQNSSYTIYHNVSGSTTWEVSTSIKRQEHKGVPKNFTIAYFVYEKVAPCGDYPPDGSVTFTNIVMECNNKPVTPKWTTAYVEDVCNNRATIIDPATIKISWDTKAADPAPELIAASQASKRLGPVRKA